MSDKLVVYYSRNGATRKAAEKLSEYLNCDITEIVSKKKYRGPIGWLAAGRASMRELKVEIIEPELNPEKYNGVILCMPVWASNIPSPVRTWLDAHKDDCKKLSYLLTFNGGGQDKTIAKLEELGGKAEKTVHFSDFERKSDVWVEKLTAFANEL
ncbi:MAG: flavodoxin [Spirochaetales bacterium]|uniref:Flavodoxin n=1 Tax=Candidatus Thalassospirochaeta sargassi TaxID=3119039 RepID=A0AAJ1IEB6_9SPIO|nr:flavodoxin [Spirochaetales bacterium]